MTRKQALVCAFEAADKRGLTEEEMRRVAGKNWRRRLAELKEEGYYFVELQSRYARRGRRPTFRWRLIAPPPPPPPPPPAEIPLFDPPAPAPVNALTEDAA